MLGPLGRGGEFVVRVRSELIEEFDEALAEMVRELSGGQIADDGDEDEFDEVPEGLEPTERRLWIPENERLRPQWLDTSRSPFGATIDRRWAAFVGNGLARI
jgi:hypothetical protein